MLSVLSFEAFRAVSVCICSHDWSELSEVFFTEERLGAHSGDRKSWKVVYCAVGYNFVMHYRFLVAPWSIAINDNI